MIYSKLLNRNLLSLSSRESNLSSRLSLTAPSAEVLVKESRNGFPVPVIKKDSREYPLHSLFNPQKEATRFAAEFPSGGYIIFLGFGCGYQIEPFLKRDSVNNILIIDFNLGYLKRQLEMRDFRKIFLDPRVHFLIDSSVADVRNYLLSHCFPVLTGDIQVIPLRSRINLDDKIFNDVFLTVRETLDSLANDFTVQTSFGKKWFTNTLTNLKKAEKTTAILNPITRAVITAAGPSLETDLDALKTEETYLIATDTSYPVLRKKGIRPDLVISIDCQHVSYHHFLSGFDKTIPLILDLASPPGITRITQTPFFFTSGHPFSIYINRHWRSFPFIDTSGGNVTHAALSLANYLGAKVVDLIGADFCYPSGKSYARGTYIYPHFHSISDKLSQGEYLFLDFILRNNHLESQWSDEERIYHTYTLNEYRNRMTDSFSNLKMKIQNHSPYSSLTASPGTLENDIQNQNSPRFFGSGPVINKWKQFIQSYYDKLKSLPDPNPPLADYFEKISQENRGLWLTLFPAAASIRKKYAKTGISSSEVLSLAFIWTMETLERYLH